MKKLLLILSILFFSLPAFAALSGTVGKVGLHTTPSQRWRINRNTFEKKPTTVHLVYILGSYTFYVTKNWRSLNERGYNYIKDKLEKKYKVFSLKTKDTSLDGIYLVKAKVLVKGESFNGGYVLTDTRYFLYIAWNDDASNLLRVYF